MTVLTDKLNKDKVTNALNGFNCLYEAMYLNALPRSMIIRDWCSKYDDELKIWYELVTITKLSKYTCVCVIKTLNSYLIFLILFKVYTYIQSVSPNSSIWNISRFYDLGFRKKCFRWNGFKEDTFWSYCLSSKWRSSKKYENHLRFFKWNCIIFFTQYDSSNYSAYKSIKI